MKVLLFISGGKASMKRNPYMCIGVNSHGPITQNAFLHKMGIRERTEVRLTLLAQNVTLRTVSTGAAEICYP